ncbi:MAG: dihydrolipoyl dehydrogenase family protein [Verrucomicrobiales bacterium]
MSIGTEEATSYDFLVLGGGSAGYAAARTAVGLGLRTAVVDGSEELGGLCILRGCMPSKALIESANRALTVRRSKEFGVDAEMTWMDGQAIIHRKRSLIAEFADYRRGQLEGGTFDLIRGTARFLDAYRVEARLREGGEERVIGFRTCLIATGSEISIPEVDGLDEAGFWTSDTVLDSASVPGSLIVLGGGAIALEMAHYLEALGTQVTVIQRGDQLLRGMDTDVAEAVADAFRKRGLTIHCGTQLGRVERNAEDDVRVTFQWQGRQQTVVAEEVLVALGRKPAVDRLGLAEAGVETEKGGVAVLPTQQTSQPHIFAAGDVCGPLEVVHLAIQQGEMAARNAAAWMGGEKPREKMDYRLALFGVFTHPQAAQVGLTEAAAAQEGRAVRVARYPFADHGKAMVMGETDGFVKMIADAQTGEIIGASVVGPEAVELIHPVVVAMHFRCTAQEFLKIPLYHPTLSEIWSYPAEELAEGKG